MAYEYNSSDVYGFVAHIGAATKRKGNELFFKYCPYCKGGSDGRDKDTLSINLDTGAFKCFRSSCGRQGHFVELCRDFDYKLVFEEIKQYRPLPQPAQIITKDSAVRYLESRGISKAIAERYRITTQKGRDNILVFPFYDENNILVSAKYRKTDFDKTRDSCKEWFEKGTKPILFGMPQCEDFDRLIITEGQIDSLSVAECGINNAVSVPNGAMGFTWLSNVWSWINKFKSVIVFGDWENGKMTLLDTLQKRLKCKVLAVRQQDYLGEKDANAILLKYGKGAIIKAVNGAEIPKLVNVKELSAVEAVNINELPRIKTNIPEIDRVIGGLIMGQVILLTGKRGNGKSTFMSQLVAEALEQGESVFIYSGELANYHFKRWLDYQLAGESSLQEGVNEYGNKIYTLSDDTIKLINNWYKGRAFIYDNGYINEPEEETESLIDTVEKVIRQHGTRLICIDNLMTALEGVAGIDLYRGQSEFVGNLKRLAVRYNVAVILVAHPRKNQADFCNDDVAGSADITNKADVVLNYERCKESEPCNSKLSVTKNRLFGRYATGDKAINLFYSDSTKRISSTSVPANKKYSWVHVFGEPTKYEDSLPWEWLSE